MGGQPQSQDAEDAGARLTTGSPGVHGARAFSLFLSYRLPPRSAREARFAFAPFKG
jgi:hypothetical protein